MELLTRTIETLLPGKEDFEKALTSGQKLRIKHGIDPTGPHIHIGNAVALWKLREFQEMGHTIVLIFGDFTARIGDPGDKDKRRPVLTKEEIEANVSRYVSQVGRILNTKTIELHYNSEWHDALTQADLIKLSRLLTVNQMLARRNFAQRIKEKKEIGIDEFLYPLLQGYDSVAIRADIELGGSDQLFNLEAGRIIQEAFGQKPQLIMTTKMLWGLDGKKMSKSWGNVVNITDEPQDMFGKVMSLGDALMPAYFEIATGLRQKERESIVAVHKNPRDQKLRLAREIVARYYGEKKARKAREEFLAVFSQKELPHHIPETSLLAGTYQAAQLLLQAGFATSKSEAKRIIEQKGMRVDDEVVISPEQEIAARSGMVITRGKVKHIRLIVLG